MNEFVCLTNRGAEFMRKSLSTESQLFELKMFSWQQQMGEDGVEEKIARPQRPSSFSSRLSDHR